MLKQAGKWHIVFSTVLLPPSLSIQKSRSCVSAIISCKPRQVRNLTCKSRRRLRYDIDDNDEDDKDNSCYNKELGFLESYTHFARGEALIVQAIVDGQPVDVLIFKGFSSSLSYSTYADPSKSVLPTRAVITKIDRIKGPFDPSNIEYIEKDLTLETFKASLPSDSPQS